MKNPRKYGIAPYKVAVVHGGPGAPGEMAPVARELASEWGVLEPFQTADTIEGQVRELWDVLSTNGEPEIKLVGYSWGAWLSAIFAARYPSVVGKLILIGSGPFEEKYARDIMNERLCRLGDAERQEVLSVIESFNAKGSGDMNRKMARFGRLISMADSYDPMHHADEVVGMQFDIFKSVWREADELRRSGELLQIMKKINCPVTAIHGDFDPHPAMGVEKPLVSRLNDFRFILINNCGHTPWIERQARTQFFNVLREELRK